MPAGAGLVTRTSDGGTDLVVLVVPGASADGVTGVHDGRVRVRISAPPEHGRANRSLCAYLAKQLDVRKTALRVVAGATSRRKTVRIDGLSPEVVRTRLALD